METILVVEGKNDYSRIKQILPNQKIITTNGSAISTDTINQLKILSKTKQIVLLLDPDFPGEKIRKTITNAIPSCSHIYLPKDIAISKNKKKVGVEHVPLELLKEYLEKVITPSASSVKFSVTDLYDLGLIGQTNSKDLREKIGLKLGFGYSNSKQFIKRLELFGITKEQIEELINDK